MAKEVHYVGGVVIANVKEEEDYYILEHVCTLQPVPQTNGQVGLTFVPVSVINPFTVYKVKKDLVFAIEEIPLEMTRQHSDFFAQLFIQRTANESKQQEPKSNLKIIN